MLRRVLLASVFFVWATAEARAAFISVVEVIGIETNESDFLDLSEVPGELDLDIIWVDTLPILLEVTLELGGLEPDEVEPLYFSAVNINLTGLSWSGFDVALIGGPVFAEINEIGTHISGALSDASGVGTPLAKLSFDPPIDDLGILVLGSPLVEIDDGVDWRIDLGTLTGDTFLIQFTPTPVPEPTSLALLSTGVVGLLGYGLRRRGTRSSNVAP